MRREKKTEITYGKRKGMKRKEKKGKEKRKEEKRKEKKGKERKASDGGKTQRCVLMAG